MIFTFSLFWSRVALSGYALGMLLALSTLWLRQSWLLPLARSAVATAFIFHLVSLSEAGFAIHRFPVTQSSQATSFLAFIIAGAFLVSYRAGSPRALTLLVVPLIFLLSLLSIYGSHGMAHAPLSGAAGVQNPWIYLHVVLITLAYAQLALAVAGSLLYMWAERSLKSKNHRQGFARRLPPLETLDTLVYRSLLVGFPMLTVGLAIGFYWSDALIGRIVFSDPKICLASVSWLLYLVLLFTRWSAGWRGRRAALMTAACFAVAIAAWLSNSLAGVHAFLTQ